MVRGWLAEGSREIRILELRGQNVFLFRPFALCPWLPIQPFLTVCIKQRRKWSAALCLTATITQKRREKPVSYHKFPQDHRTKAWLDRVRRVDMPPLENSHVCSEHFLPSCFEIDFRAQLMGEKVRKHLRDDAIPSLFKYGPEPKKARLSSESRLQKQNHKQVSTVTRANFYHPVLFCKNLVLFDLPAWRTLRDCSPVRIR